MLLKYLDKEEFENIMVCSQDFHKGDYEGLADCFEQIEMNRAIGMSDLKSIREVRKQIKKYNPDIIYAKRLLDEQEELLDKMGWAKIKHLALVTQQCYTEITIKEKRLTAYAQNQRQQKPSQNYLYRLRISDRGEAGDYCVSEYRDRIHPESD